MEGRWAVLALRAARLGALDFKHITRNEPSSIRKEYLILDSMENSLNADYLKVLAMGETDRPKRAELVLDAIREEMPWAAKKNGNSTKRLADRYKQLEVIKKQIAERIKKKKGKK